MAEVISEISVAAVIEADGDTSTAAELLLSKLRSMNPDLYELKASQAMKMWAQDIVRSTRTRLRGRLADAPKGESAVVHQRLDAKTIGEVAVTWFNWPLMDGSDLGNATRDKVLQAAGKYARDARVFSRRHQWLEAIAERMTDEAVTVREVMTVADVGALAAQFGVTAE